jgi:hypothetical protein
LLHALLLALALGSLVVGSWAAPATRQSIAVYALSSGKGVSDAAWNALGAARDYLKGLAATGVELEVIEQRLGLEGETRLCAAFADPAAAEAALARLHELTRNIELVDVSIEPCAPAAGG